MTDIHLSLKKYNKIFKIKHNKELAICRRLQQAGVSGIIKNQTNERRAQKEEQHKHPPANRLFADVD